MITPQMTEAEVLQEINKDLPNVVSISNNKDAKVRRIILKSASFPVYLYSYITSPRKNKWIILWEARNKKNVGDNSLISFVSYQETAHGRYAYMPTWADKKLILIIYPPHFFSRFAERMNLSLTGVELIRKYFERNNNYAYELGNVEECTQQIYGSSLDGVALGLCSKEHNIILFKTFITYEMTKGDQIEAFAQNEEIRKEIHEKEIMDIE